MLKQASDRLRFRLWTLRDAVRDRLHGRAHRRAAFQQIYQENLWGSEESVSGTGSEGGATEVVRRELPALLRRYGVRSLLDAPCGDFRWMAEVAPALIDDGVLDSYAGVDIVPELIEANRAAYASEKVTFGLADIATDPLPAADLVLCRDCFIHLPTRMIRGALGNFRATGARYLLLTSDRDAEPYRDIPIGSFRRIRFTRPPFSFPPPLATLDEDETGSRRLCLWELPSLPAEWIGTGSAG